MNELSSLLKPLGFEAKEAALYVAALKLGPSSVQRLAIEAKIPRATTYLLIDRLIEKGLISRHYENKKLKIIAVEPERLILLAKKNEDLAKNISSETPKAVSFLKTLYRSRQYQPQIRYFDGLEGIKIVLNLSLKAKEILIHCSGYKKEINPRLEAVLNKYFDLVVGAKIKTYELIGGSPDAKEYFKEYQSKENQIKITDQKMGSAHIDKLIFVDKVIIISFEFLNAVLIQNQQIADFERDIFWKLWSTTSTTA